MSENQGWVKVYREILDKPIWTQSNPEQKVILMTLLLLVSHKPNTWKWGSTTYEIQPGQCITSLEQLEAKCGKGVTKQNIRTALKNFEKYEFLTNQSTKTGRLITIVNWGFYQGDSEESNKDFNRQLTKSQQRANKEPNTYQEVKNDKNVKKEKNIKYICSEPGEPAPNCSDIFLPLNDNTYFNVPLDKMESWEQAYPAVDVKQELLKMCVWLDANPKKKKTANGVVRFITNWLSRTQDRGGSIGFQCRDPEPSNKENQGGRVLQ